MKKFITYTLLVLVLGIAGCDDNTGSGVFNDKPMSSDKAKQELNKRLQNITWTQNFNQRRANIELTQANLMTTLPDIATAYPLVVVPSKSGVVAEIFVSSEKSGTGTDGWMREAAEQFNSGNFKTKSGANAQIAIRKIASGTAYQYIGSGKYIPTAYSPSNHLWLKMVASHGVQVTPVLEKTVGNVAGVVLKKDKYEQLKGDKADLTIPEIIDAVIQGQLVMGYTNPYSSSTGLNFLVTVLNSFSGATDNAMLKNDVVSSFEAFQQGVPYVAMTTLQMRDSVANNGVLDAFVMEYQTFTTAKPSMTNDYHFIPFGVRHDNPLYLTGDVSAQKREVVELFAQQLQTQTAKKKIKKYGFDAMLNYASQFALPNGNTVINAQKIWKEKKSAGKKTIAIFLADTSGSMGGTRLKELKRALKKGSDFISKENHIGLVSFNTNVNVEVPPQAFSLIQKSAFYAAVEDLHAGGGTAIYDGVIVSLSLLLEAQKAEPDTKLMLFVLSDGENTQGHDLDNVAELIRGLGIPIYSIAYATEIPELKKLSSLVEATVKNANEGNAAYAIGNLLNAQM